MKLPPQLRAELEAGRDIFERLMRNGAGLADLMCDEMLSDQELYTLRKYLCAVLWARDGRQPSADEL